MEKTQTSTLVQPIRLLLTPEEAAGALGLHRSRIWMLMGQGKLRGIKIGKSRRFLLTELNEFIAREMAEQHGEEPPAA